MSIRPTDAARLSPTPRRSEGRASRASAYRAGMRGLIWAVIGGLGVMLVWRFALDRMLYVLAGGVAAWGVLLLINHRLARATGRCPR